jgi:hypothetical protein
MLFKVSDPSKTEALVKRAFFIAYGACGGTSGLGFLQARSSVTEDQVWQNVAQRGDYPAVGPGIKTAKDGMMDAYGDYVFGRMMKLSVKFDPKNGVIQVSDSNPRPDYQGWSGGRFPSYASLIEEAALCLEVKLSPS